MDQPAVAARLRALAASNAKRSKTARLREVFDDVEAALAAGTKRTDVLATLNAHGLHMSLSTFETTLKRLRAKRNGVGTTPQAAQADPTQAHRSPSSSQTEHAQNGSTVSCDPMDLDRIMTTRPDLIGLAKLAKRNKK